MRGVCQVQDALQYRSEQKQTQMQVQVQVQV
jgi:primosomal replication protein N